MIILVGASASGKTEVLNYLVKKYGYKKLVTYTTREKRTNEVDGVDYNFITKEKFNELNKLNFFYETMEYNCNQYGTAYTDITMDKVVILDPKGFKKYNNSNLEGIVSFFLDASSEIRLERMIKRGDPIESIEFRKNNDNMLFSKEEIKGINYIISSDNLKIEEIANTINDIYKNRNK